jgi:hypothetical protein
LKRENRNGETSHEPSTITACTPLAIKTLLCYPTPRPMQATAHEAGLAARDRMVERLRMEVQEELERRGAAEAERAAAQEAQAQLLQVRGWVGCGGINKGGWKCWRKT